MAANDWVALVLVGSNRDDLKGTIEVCRSILHYEPGVLQILLVCDTAEAAGHISAISAEFEKKLSLVIAPPKHPVDARGRYLGANLIYGLEWIHRRFVGEFVLKLDTDALVIGNFAENIRSFLDSNADCGICGTLGRTSAREDEFYGHERYTISWLVRMVLSLPLSHLDQISSLADQDLWIFAKLTMFIARLRSTLTGRAVLCSEVASSVQEAIRHGYRWLEYCQGGGYAISWSLLNAMGDAGYLGHSSSLYSLPTGEDVLIAMYCRSLGFHVMDYSERGQPFACSWRGLPYPPEVLIERGHAIIHSLKNNKDASRDDLQFFFQALRK
jgi:hypothetical protein